MNSLERIALSPTPEQHQRLLALQRAFARVCNELAPVVQESRTWNRVALHHLTYRRLRETFPELGSQMVCNAIYSVSRAARLVFQSPSSPFHHTRLVGRPLPRLCFTDTCPVYFDRHTLSIKGGLASMFTLDGRMRFQLALGPELETAFHQHKLLEVALQRRCEVFELTFAFGPASAIVGGRAAEAVGQVSLSRRSKPDLPSDSSNPSGEASSTQGGDPATAGAQLLPDYLSVEEPA